MPGSLTRGGVGNVPGIPGACATRNFTYLARGPWWCHGMETLISPYVHLWLPMDSPPMGCFFLIGLRKFLIKQWSCRRLETPWRPYVIIVIYWDNYVLIISAIIAINILNNSISLNSIALLLSYSLWNYNVANSLLSRYPHDIVVFIIHCHVS